MSTKMAIRPAARGKREHTKFVNRQSIFQAARIVFARLGYTAATVRDIIRESGLAAGTFYNYFDSKEDIANALAADFAERFATRFRARERNTASLYEFVRSTYQVYFEFLVAENAQALQENAPHYGLLGTHQDGPEIGAIVSEIQYDLIEFLGAHNLKEVDVDYFVTSAIAIGRDLGVRMLERAPVDPDKTAIFAASLLVGGAQKLGLDI